MSESTLLAGVLGLAMSSLQFFLLQRIIKVRAARKRAALFALKLPLWAVAVAGIGLLWGVGPLIAFALCAGVGYPALSIVYFLRVRKKEG